MGCKASTGNLLWDLLLSFVTHNLLGFSTRLHDPLTFSLNNWNAAPRTETQYITESDIHTIREVRFWTGQNCSKKVTWKQRFKDP